MSKLTVLLLSLVSATAFAGNYADNGSEASPQNNKAEEQHFYLELGANEYYFNQPGMGLPFSTGYGNTSSFGYLPNTPVPATPGDNYDADNWSFAPSVTLGYQFLTDNPDLQKIFGQQNAIELRASYFHSTGSQNETYNDQPYYVNPWLITGKTNEMLTSSFDMTNSAVDFDNTYEDIGLYYTGNKVINNTLINAPYVGIDVSYLKQDSNYNYTFYSPDPDNNQKPNYASGAYTGIGSDDLSSYYMGLAFGDKATWLLEKNYGVYGKLGAGLYWMHTKLNASQTPVTTAPDGYEDQVMLDNYTVNTSDDQATFKLNAEVGLNYYFKNNQDQMSPRVTLLAGLDYWNDVAYADNPTQANEQVKIGYDSAVNPYAGLQLHIPL